MRSLILALLRLGCALAVSSCGGPSLPSGVTCRDTITVEKDGAALSSTLAAAPAGSCVLAKAGTYRGNFDVPENVLLLGDSAGPTVLQGDADSAPAVRLHPGSGLFRAQVLAPSGPKGVGVSIITGPVRIQDVEVSGARSVGIYAICTEDCGRPDLLSRLDSVSIHGNSIGLWTQGAQLQVTGGRIAEQIPASLTSGLGVIASHGAKLTMNGSVVEKNGFVGVLIDGAGGTEAALSEVSVLDNQDRGIWGQQLTGTSAAPKLTVERCNIERNRLAGIGLRASSGARISGGRIAATGPVQDAADGVGLFEGTGQVLVDGVALNQNQRSQVLVDNGAEGIVISNCDVQAAGSQQGVVVQGTNAAVQSSSGQTNPRGLDALPVQAGQVPLPGL